MSNELKLGEGGRKNADKPRYDLIEPFAHFQKAMIYTKGARKYAPNNWLQGMSWSKCVASAKRHMEAFLRGEDYDYDPTCPDCQRSKLNGTLEEWHCTNHTGQLHTALAAWNWDALTSYYKHFPQGDDRLHNVLPKPKYGLDIDEVLCDWVGGWTELYGLPTPTAWWFDYEINNRFDQMRKEGTLDEFYANLKPKIKPSEIPFEPVAYVTSRPVDSEVTKAWLAKHGFSTAKVITVAPGTSKADAIKSAGIDIFVDDAYPNFEALNRAGICCYLMDAPHNRRYDVGYKRIYSLMDLKR